MSTPETQNDPVEQPIDKEEYEAAMGNASTDAAATQSSEFALTSQENGSAAPAVATSEAPLDAPSVAPSAEAPTAVSASLIGGTSPALSGATPSAPIEGALNPSNALAGTSGVPAGQLSTGMAAGEPTVKLSSTVPPEQPSLDLGDTPTNVNVSAVGAPHPIVAKVNGLVAELKLIISNIEKSPAIMRAEKDLQTCEEWVVQHFEDLKRKL